VGGVRWVRIGVVVHQANFPGKIFLGAQDALGNECSHLPSQKPEEDPGTNSLWTGHPSGPLPSGLWGHMQPQAEASLSLPPSPSWCLDLGSSPGSPSSTMANLTSIFSTGLNFKQEPCSDL
jgi:hypothetical protein